MEPKNLPLRAVILKHYFKSSRTFNNDRRFPYPTTYVVDRSGNIVGDPIVGAITEKKQAETLQKLIDQALAADMG